MTGIFFWEYCYWRIQKCYTTTMDKRGG